MQKIFLTIVLFSTVLLSSCDNVDDWISRRYPGRCFFFFYLEHPTSILFAAYKTPGMWVYAYTENVLTNNNRHVYIQSGSSTSQQEIHDITTAREKSCRYVMGARNDIGLIIGCTYFNGPRAYDRTCPNCPTIQTLRWAYNAQHVECSKCKRTYDLETGAIVDGDKGEALMRYGITYDETRADHDKVLYVGN